MTKKICLITPAHLSFNPRLVKEADALCEAGYSVTVISCNYNDSITQFDNKILKSAKWKSLILKWSKKKNPTLFWYSRIRKYFLTKIYRNKLFKKYLSDNKDILLRIFDRVLPELEKLVLNHPADLYIAHNLQSLPIAYEAAKKYNSLLGFDAEDLHSEMFREEEQNSVYKELAEYYERTFIKKCDYLTTASPGISRAYRKKYNLEYLPPVILNVFPLLMSEKKVAERHDSTLKIYWFSQTIGRYRGLNDILEALGKLNNMDIELHLLGNWQTGFKKEFFERTQELKIDNNKIYSHPLTCSNNMINFASSFDIGLALEEKVSNNRNICLTNKIFTYMLAGNAIIATNTDGQKEISENAGNAIKTYESGDIDSLVSIIEQWYLNRNKLQTAKEESLKLGISKYNWDNEKKKFLDLVEAKLN